MFTFLFLLDDKQDEEVASASGSAISSRNSFSRGNEPTIYSDSRAMEARQRESEMQGRKSAFKSLFSRNASTDVGSESMVVILSC